MLSLIESLFMKIGFERDDLYVTTTLTVIGVNLLALTVGSIGSIYLLTFAFTI